MWKRREDRGSTASGNCGAAEVGGKGIEDGQRSLRGRAPGLTPPRTFFEKQ